MTAIAAKSARPPSTAIAWSAADGLYVEFPTKAGPPYICRFPKTIEGLQSALNVLLENPTPQALDLRQQDHPAIRRLAPKIEASDALRDAAAALVRKMAK